MINKNSHHDHQTKQYPQKNKNKSRPSTSKTNKTIRLSIHNRINKENTTIHLQLKNNPQPPTNVRSQHTYRRIGVSNSRLRETLKPGEPLCAFKVKAAGQCVLLGNTTGRFIVGISTSCFFLWSEYGRVLQSSSAFQRGPVWSSVL